MSNSTTEVAKSVHSQILPVYKYTPIKKIRKQSRASVRCRWLSLQTAKKGKTEWQRMKNVFNTVDPRMRRTIEWGASKGTVTLNAQWTRKKIWLVGRARRLKTLAELNQALHFSQSTSWRRLSPRYANIIRKRQLSGRIELCLILEVLVALPIFRSWVSVFSKREMVRSKH